jgi:geranylgeranyl transferase type-1 subunit beta
MYAADNYPAGYTYCGVAALSFLNRLPDSSNHSRNCKESNGSLSGLTNIPALIRWLVSRQVGYHEDDDEGEEEDSVQKQREALAGVYKDRPSVPGLSLEEEEFVGFNGRCNKMVDTCYAFWVTASLDVSPTKSQFGS